MRPEPSLADAGQSASLLKAINDAVLAMAAELRVAPILQRLVESARELVKARYAALGIPDGEGGFAQFITSGMSAAQIEAIGPLPRTHGLLGAMLTETAPYRTSDIRTDPRFQWWPPPHPRMSSFLGVPILAKGRVIAAFYLTDKIGADEFSEDDQAAVEMLAAHAAIAIENARLFERSRELSVVEERTRLARELHDSVSQTLFSISLVAEAAATLVDRDAAKAKTQLEGLREMARAATQEMRSLIFELRPADLDAEGLVATLRKHIDVLRRVYPMRIEFKENVAARPPPAVEREVYRIAQEALNNAIKHSQADRIDVELSSRDAMISLLVADDGKGFEPKAAELRATKLGITSMEERAESINGVLRIESSEAGTRVELEVPVE
ncbi:MAG: GAF domain-containing sensor histidine kinase [Chloroflexi bacterium]|nr:MAG: GAF domain-containing sensor histidine kinase [Chloroflexota bacterium]